MKDEITFKNQKIDFQKLLKLEFMKENGYYKYEKKIMGDEFSLVIKIDTNNIVTSHVIELSTNEEYMLYNVASSVGDFVGKMKEEYSNVIINIKNNCCSKRVFKSECANLMIEYVRNKYHDELEFLWEKSNNAIWRNKESQKWYGALLTVQKKKLGIKEEGTIEIIDLRLQTDRIEEIVDNTRYFPGYHMNKKHWITIKLDGSVDVNEVYGFIDNSYMLSKKK